MLRFKHNISNFITSQLKKKTDFIISQFEIKAIEIIPIEKNLLLLFDKKIEKFFFFGKIMSSFG